MTDVQLIAAGCLACSFSSEFLAVKGVKTVKRLSGLRLRLFPLLSYTVYQCISHPLRPPDSPVFPSWSNIYIYLHNIDINIH